MRRITITWFYFWLGIFTLLCSHSLYAQTNLALNQVATASSALSPATNAVDDNAGTRWESEHGVSPSFLTIDLGAPAALATVVIDWEAANAANYKVQGSNDGNVWNTLATRANGTFGNRTDEVAVSGSYRYIRIYCTARSAGNAWGYSIWEIKVYGDDSPPVDNGDSGETNGENVAANKLATSSSALSAPSNAVDDNGGTRWESTHGAGAAWLQVDLGGSYALSAVAIDWEAANAASYLIEGSTDGNNWNTLASHANGEFGTRTDTHDVSGEYRYVRINATERSAGNNWGYSIWELKVFGTATGTTDPTDPDPTDPEEPDPYVPNPDASYKPLYNSTYSVASSRNWHVEADGTIVTIASGRARSRHESENIFYTFPSHYHEHRTFGIEIEDHVAAGEDYIAIYYSPQYAHYREPECRSAYANPNRADFNNNAKFEPMKVVPTNPDGTGETWVCYIRRNAHNGSDGVLRVGDWMEVEFQQFLGKVEGDPVVEGQTVYYTDTYRFKLGQPGIYIVEDETLNEQISAGGTATAPFVRAGEVVPKAKAISTNGDMLTYYNEQNQVATSKIMDGIEIYDTYVVDSGLADWTTFFREGLNTRWDSHNNFLNGRRLFHSSFETGVHAEAGNPDFVEIAGKADGLNVNTTCVGCHVHNGRGDAPVAGANFTTMVMKVGSGGVDTYGQPLPHPYFGAMLQTHSLNAAVPAEANSNVTYSARTGFYGDGSSYTLQVPSYHINVLDGAGGNVNYFSPRMPQTVVGLGLLEAVPEETLMQRNDPGDANGDGISGRASLVYDAASGTQKVGRFGWKANKFSLKQFAASALHEDMGVTTSIFPNADCGENQTACKNAGHNSNRLEDDRLELLADYVKTLGAPSRHPETVNNANVLHGETVFNNIGCAGCHTPTMNTGNRHPMAELRNQTIHPYTDLLLHDMGEDLADNLTNTDELNREWRTPALWGLSATQAVNGHTRLLHDGRARDINEAILWHGGEAGPSQAAYKALSGSDRNAVQAFLESL